VESVLRETQQGPGNLAVVGDRFHGAARRQIERRGGDVYRVVRLGHIVAEGSQSRREADDAGNLQKVTP
jgi:hypothetical protein